ncbi:hypothetical protein ACQKP8_25740, partial [Photobacterium alginatilyticum]|uniref:hypothetical protein n=1 Tax=Photobacterium alginatilyticum TaxID=1775171 RepID=UPI004068CB62
MPNTNEQRLDIISNCNLLLTKLHGYQSTDNRPEGRMIAQLTWLKEHAINSRLPLPVDPVMLSTLRRVYLDAAIDHIASKPRDEECVYKEIRIPMRKILSLALRARLIVKEEYLGLIPSCIDALLYHLKQPSRELTLHETQLEYDLIKLRELILDRVITIPKKTYMPEFESFIECQFSLEDVPNVIKLFRIVN